MGLERDEIQTHDIMNNTERERESVQRVRRQFSRTLCLSIIGDLIMVLAGVSQSITINETSLSNATKTVGKRRRRPY